MNRPAVVTTTKYYLIVFGRASTSLYQGRPEIKFSLGVFHIRSSLGQKKPS